jgi:hypothetical protein
MEILISILTGVGLSLAGLLIYGLIAIKDHIKDFSFKKFFNDNKPFWLWAFSLQLTFSLLINLVPESSESIKILSGLDLTQPMAFLMSGLALSKIANWAVGRVNSPSNQIGKKQF